MPFLIKEIKEEEFQYGESYDIKDIVEARKWYSVCLGQFPWRISIGISLYNSIPEIMILLHFYNEVYFIQYFDRITGRKPYYSGVVIENLKKYYRKGMETIGAVTVDHDRYLINHSQLEEVLRLHLQSIEHMKVIFQQSQEQAEAYYANIDKEEKRAAKQILSERIQKEEARDLIGSRIIADDENEDLVGSLKDLRGRGPVSALAAPVSALAATVSTLPNGGLLDDRPPGTTEIPKKEPKSWFSRFYGGRNICSKRKNKRKTKGKRHFYETRKYKI